MTTWILLIALWSGNVREFHYFGTYSTYTACEEAATRICEARTAEQRYVVRDWQTSKCVEVLK